MSISPEARKRCLVETALNLTRAEYEVIRQADDSLAVCFQGNPLCNVTNPGGITYRQENLTTPELEDAKDNAYEIVRTTAEYMRNMEQAPPLKADSLGDRYKVLADFNGTVLAGKDSPHGVQFVTWDWDFDRSGVSHGHYWGDQYNNAKHDFVTRSGLIDEHCLFSKEQLVEIYRCCSDTIDHGYDLSAKEEKIIDGIRDQIEYAVLNLREQINAHREQAEQELQSPTM